MPVSQLQMENQSGECYRSIGKLPLFKFIDCVVDNNLRALITTGEPTQEELQAALLEINSQYAEAIGDAEYKLYLSCFKELTILTLKLQAIGAMIETLKMFPHAELFDMLNSMLQTDFKFDFNNPDEYFHLLKRCFQRASQYRIQLGMKQLVFEGIKQKFSESKAPNREYFQSVLITLSDHAKYPILDSITVFEFCERIHRLNRYHDQLKRNK